MGVLGDQGRAGHAGPRALDLGDPAAAARFFRGARLAGYASGQFARDDALFLTRSAGADLALGDVEQAVDAARRAWEQSSGMTSARPADAPRRLRGQLVPYASVPAARDFLELTAPPA